MIANENPKTLQLMMWDKWERKKGRGERDAPGKTPIVIISIPLVEME